ncbi:MAG: B12-binding domain-containing radical SAM protein [Desulfobacterales bacterium]|nr:B12-binding domain-containing radical SAM protein [Desulfobacterales bacterium]
MKILLIIPAPPGDRCVDSPIHRTFPQLAMPTVAAATPPQYEVKILDEKAEPIAEAPDADIVGITVDTTIANYAYSLAHKFRERGSFVVLGGPHVSVLPHEAALHADSVIVGDAEDTWPQFLSDFSKGQSRRIYYSSHPSLSHIKPPRLDLLKPGAYPTLSITHASRGCPYHCEFCCIPAISGNCYRHRPVDEVAKEVEAHDGPLTIFWDDNLTADREYARLLFTALKPLKKRWIGQATILFALDRVLVKQAAEAGCIALFLGIESFSAKSLKEAKKGFNRTERYSEGIRNLHDHGIGVEAGVIFGFDHDDPAVFERTLDAAAALRLDCVNFNILTPFPGTQLYDRLKKEGRLLTGDWSYFQPYKNVVFQPKQMTPHQLFNGYRRAVKNYYRTWPILKRVFFSPWFMSTKRLSWFMNLQLRKNIPLIFSDDFPAEGATNNEDLIEKRGHIKKSI